ncbi:hypothetical protein L6R53_31540 [Myxococcota bacterium]|nr:hypothetical protein [Myxococcota bacterium]
MRAAISRCLPDLRIARRKASRVLKVMICVMLVFGLFPGSDELVESVAHLIHDGHLPHSEQHDRVGTFEDCGDSDEHGCTPLAHRCQCCVSIMAMPQGPPGFNTHEFQPARKKYRSVQAQGPPSPGVKPNLRPPIA